MKTTYFFPIFRDDDAKTFFEYFLKSDFYLDHEAQSIICVVNAGDENNLNVLKQLSIAEPKIKTFLAEKEFSFNSAFRSSLEYFDGDVVLLGDLKIQNLSLLFQKCLEKHLKGAKIVQINKHYAGIKGFFVRILQSIYKFFTRLFTSKTDECNIESLGLLDREFVDIIKTLPHKCCFLKNTQDHYEIPCGNIIVDSKVPCHKTNLKKPTFALKTTIVSSCLFALNIVLLIALNLVIKGLFVTNILLILLEFIFAILIVVTIPKHVFDCRNIVYEKDFVPLALLKVEKQVRAPKNDKNAQNEQKNAKKSSKIAKNASITTKTKAKTNAKPKSAEAKKAAPKSASKKPTKISEKHSS